MHQTGRKNSRPCPLPTNSKRRERKLTLHSARPPKSGPSAYTRFARGSKVPGSRAGCTPRESKRFCGMRSVEEYARRASLLKLLELEGKPSDRDIVTAATLKFRLGVEQCEDSASLSQTGWRCRLCWMLGEDAGASDREILSALEHSFARYTRQFGSPTSLHKVLLSTRPQDVGLSGLFVPSSLRNGLTDVAAMAVEDVWRQCQHERVEDACALLEGLRDLVQYHPGLKPEYLALNRLLDGSHRLNAFLIDRGNGITPAVNELWGTPLREAGAQLKAIASLTSGTVSGGPDAARDFLEGIQAMQGSELFESIHMM